jgi:hypothetical protein
MVIPDWSRDPYQARIHSRLMIDGWPESGIPWRPGLSLSGFQLVPDYVYDRQVSHLSTPSFSAFDRVGVVTSNDQRVALTF